MPRNEDNERNGDNEPMAEPTGSPTPDVPEEPTEDDRRPRQGPGEQATNV